MKGRGKRAEDRKSGREEGGGGERWLRSEISNHSQGEKMLNVTLHA